MGSAKVSHGGTPLNAKEPVIHDQDLVAVLKSLHDELDTAAPAGWKTAGGWSKVVAYLVGRPRHEDRQPDD